MSRQTLVRTKMPGPAEGVEEIWTVLTYEQEHEWWSEVLDGNRHPIVDRDDMGYETLHKAFGDTLEEARKTGLDLLIEQVKKRGGSVVQVGNVQAT